MLTPSEIQNDAVLYEDLTNYVADWMVTARIVFKTDDLLAKSAPIGLGNETIKYDTAVELSAAFFANEYVDNLDEFDATSTVAYAPILQRPFSVPPRKVLGAASNGVDIVGKNAAAAMYQVLKKEQSLAFLGYSFDGTNYDHNGVYNAAGSTVAGATWATAGNPLANVVSARNTIADYYEGPLNLFLHVDQKTEVDASLTSGDGAELPMVENILGGGRIIQVNTDQTAGTGLLCPTPNAEFGEMMVLENYNVRQDNATGGKGNMNPHRGWAGVCELPFLKVPKAYCTITGI